MRSMSVFVVMAFCGAMLCAQTPVIVQGGVLNGASFSKTDAGVAPGSLVSIFGTDLAPQVAQNDTTPLSTQLANVSVTFNGIIAGLDFVAGGQINAQVPWDVLPPGVTQGQASVVVTRNGVPSNPVAVNIVPTAPGIFAVNAIWAIAINPDGSLAAPDGAIPGFPTRPAHPGDPLIILATGLGAVTPAVANGADSLDTLRTTNALPTVLVGGITSPLGFSGLSPQFPGVNQLNISVPNASPTGTVPLQIQMGTFTSTDQVKIAVQ